VKRFFAIFLMMLLLCGCGNEAGYVPTGNGLDEQEATLPVLGPEQPEQTFSLAYHPEKTLNPYVCADYTNRALFSLLYQSLFVVDKDYRVEPQLCRSYKVSADKRVYVFYPEAAVFADGSRLSVVDVMASLEAARTSPVYSGRLYNVTEISVTSDGGVQVELATAYDNFPLLLDIPILRATQVNADFPLGTGPYALESNAAGRWLRLRQDWWCKAKLPVSAERIPLVKATTAKDIRDRFELGNVGVVCANPGADTYVDFRCDHGLWDCENGIFLYLGCRAKSGVFRNETVRRALTHAIDRDFLVLEYYRTFAKSATLPASPDAPCYNDALAARYGFDAELFRQALAAEGLSGKSIVLLVNSADGRRTKVAQAIADMLESCSLKVTVRALSGDAYKKALKNNDFDLHLGQTMLSPNMDLSQFYDSDGTLSFGGMGDVGIFSLCQDALANEGNYTALHQAVMEDAMLCPVAFLSYGVYVQPGLVTEFSPARDCIFYYSLGKTLDEILVK
jgi:peptide/nickel transport system substrate-binding protein